MSLCLIIIAVFMFQLYFLTSRKNENMNEDIDDAANIGTANQTKNRIDRNAVKVAQDGIPLERVSTLPPQSATVPPLTSAVKSDEPFQADEKPQAENIGSKNEEQTNIAMLLRQLSPLTALQPELKHLADVLAEETAFNKQFHTEKQKLIDKLYDENRQYSNNIIDEFKEQLLRAIVEQLDDADDKIAAFGQKPCTPESYSALLKSFTELADDFRDVLQKQLNFTYFKDEAGAKIDLKRHKIIRSLPTTEPQKDKTIAVAKRFGYADTAGNVIQKETVDSYCYETPKTPVTPTDKMPPVTSIVR
ncbi:MAG: hypothetical protein LBU65_04655 [Planctomycetaceae bacterium]|jgi:hypothetical protein|nr:hypothetical protein [Planctomycetaceae bacterium]